MSHVVFTLQGDENNTSILVKLFTDCILTSFIHYILTEMKNHHTYKYVRSGNVYWNRLIISKYWTGL